MVLELAAGLLLALLLVRESVAWWPRRGEGAAYESASNASTMDTSVDKWNTWNRTLCHVPTVHEQGLKGPSSVAKLGLDPFFSPVRPLHPGMLGGSCGAAPIHSTPVHGLPRLHSRPQHTTVNLYSVVPPLDKPVSRI